MRLLHVVFCLSLALVSNAQQWCMPSATCRSRSWSIEGEGYREITCEGDSLISVPSFVEIGTIVCVDTETGEYMDRVKK